MRYDKLVTCWSCNKVKGKRVCPARGGDLICSKCCGTKRRVEINCPEDCPYLHGADPNWRSATRQKEDARFLSRFLALNEGQVMLLLFTHHLMLSVRARFAALSDEELQAVIGTALKTMDTRAKGIVYSHPSGSPHLDKVADWLARVLSERGSIAAAPEASDSDVRTVLDAINQAIRDHAAGGHQVGYLETAERVLQSSLGGTPAIELPDELGVLDEPPSDLIVSP